MDLETMMTKVDMHKYNCAKEFLDDIDLICANALEYNPDRYVENFVYKRLKVVTKAWIIDLKLNIAFPTELSTKS